MAIQFVREDTRQLATRMVSEAASRYGNMAEARKNVERMILDKMFSEDAKCNPGSVLHLKDLWEAFVGPADEHSIGRLLQESVIPTTAFYTITGQLATRYMQAGFDLVRPVLDQLVTPVMTRSRRNLIAGIGPLEDIQDITEGEDYPDIYAEEQAVEAPEPKPSGGVAWLTKWMILYDQMSELEKRLRDMGKVVAYKREVKGLNYITDQTGYKCYYPHTTPGVAAQVDLYRTSGSEDTSTWYKRNITSSALAFADYNSINSALTLLAARTDAAGRKYMLNRVNILAPQALQMKVMNALNATQILTENSSVTGVPEMARQMSPNPILMLAGSMPIPVVTPLLDSLSTTYWYIGDAKSTFEEEIHQPPQTEAMTASNDSYLKRDIVMVFKGSFKSRVTCVGDGGWLRLTA